MNDATDNASTTKQEKPLSSAKKRVLAGKYILEREIARGAMGRVFLATQIALRRKVAVKVMVPKYGGPDFDKRFMLEAQSVAALSHPNIVVVHDYGQTESDLLFMAMEFLDGPTLGRHITTEGPFQVGRACNVVLQIGRALRNAHGAGLVHRDLKPGNVILLKDDEGGDVAKVLDFGLAKVFESQPEQEDPNAPLTRDGLMLGTPKYMAPEQIIGKEINPTTDLYSLGALFYHMLSGRPPFEGANDVEVLHAQLKSSPIPVHQRDGCEGIRPELSAFIERCMSREQADRPQSAKEFIKELRNVVSAAVADPEYRSAFAVGEEEGLSASVITGGNSFGSSHSGRVIREDSVPSTSELHRDEMVPLEAVALENKRSKVPYLFAAAMLLLLIGLGFFFLQGKDEPNPVVEDGRINSGTKEDPSKNKTEDAAKKAKDEANRKIADQKAKSTEDAEKKKREDADNKLLAGSDEKADESDESESVKKVEAKPVAKVQPKRRVSKRRSTPRRTKAVVKETPAAKEEPQEPMGFKKTKDNQNVDGIVLATPDAIDRAVLQPKEKTKSDKKTNTDVPLADDYQ